MHPAPLALQLYTLRDATREDFAGTVRKIAEIGYSAVELAGYGNLTASEAAAALQNAGLKVAGMHVGLEQLRTDVEAALAGAELFDCPFITCPSFPRDSLSTAAQCEVAGEELDRIGARIRRGGRRLAFHNHGIEFEKVDGRLRIDWMLGAAEPRNLEMELDVYWCNLAGVDPVCWLRQNGARVTQVHLKDQKELGKSGRIDFPAVLQAMEEIGAVESYIFEQEEYSFDPLECTRLALQQWREWGQS